MRLLYSGLRVLQGRVDASGDGSRSWENLDLPRLRVGIVGMQQQGAVFINEPHSPVRSGNESDCSFRWPERIERKLSVHGKKYAW